MISGFASLSPYQNRFILVLFEATFSMVCMPAAGSGLHIPRTALVAWKWMYNRKLGDIIWETFRKEEACMLPFLKKSRLRFKSFCTFNYVNSLTKKTSGQFLIPHDHKDVYITTFMDDGEYVCCHPRMPSARNPRARADSPIEFHAKYLGWPCEWRISMNSFLFRSRVCFLRCQTTLPVRNLNSAPYFCSPFCYEL